jgi:hypothetical protein
VFHVNIDFDFNSTNFKPLISNLSVFVLICFLVVSFAEFNSIFFTFRLAAHNSVFSCPRSSFILISILYVQDFLGANNFAEYTQSLVSSSLVTISFIIT